MIDYSFCPGEDVYKNHQEIIIVIY